MDANSIYNMKKTQLTIYMKIKIIITAFIALATFTSTWGNSTRKMFKIKSPDGHITMLIGDTGNGQWTYSVKAFDTQLIDTSHIGYASGGNDVMPGGMRLAATARDTGKGEWRPVWGKRASVHYKYNELDIVFAAANDSRMTMGITARVYDDGAAFRYYVPENSSLHTPGATEMTSFRFAGDFTAWFYNNENHNIGPERLSESNGTRLPVMTIKAADDRYMAIHEADLRTDAPMQLASKAGSTLFYVKSQPTELKAGYISAWRVVFVSKTPGGMVDSHLLELLNPEPQGDFSWVRPGVAVWDWRINGAVWDGYTYRMDYPSWVRMIDFAAEQGFSHLVLDANWYGPEFETESDPLNGDKATDVKRIIAYGKHKGVGVWLYLNDVGGRRYPIETTLKQYAEWGAAGIKYGFMKGTPKEKNLWTQKITRLCAENRLLVDFHDGPVHPYGQMRTWPNAVTREYCQAQLDGHKVFQPKTFLTSVFVNMIAGPIDMNNGMFDLRQGKTTRVDENKPVPSTVTAEAARTLITFSGATIIPDIPEYYRKHPDLLRFISAQKMPWVESRTLAGEIGQYIVMMRETEYAWLVAAATDEEARHIKISTGFLPSGGTYEAEVMQDGAGAHYLTNRESTQTKNATVNHKSTIEVDLAPGGGACILIKKK